MRKFYFIFSFIIGIVSIANAQVETRYYKEGTYISNLRKPKRQNIEIKKLPSINLSSINETNNEKGRMNLFYFGKGIDLSLNLKDGQWDQTEDGRIWSMTLLSDGAVSMNFIFSNFFLPEGAELYIVNQNETTVYGPVTSKAISDKNSFLTDVIDGDCMSIYLFEPSEVKGQSSLTINRVIHGYRKFSSNLTENKTRSSTLTYFPNVACYPDYEKESDAVGLVLAANGEAWGSGLLIMSTDFSFKPYFLTSFSCFDYNLDGTMSDGDISTAESCLFKFHYKTTECENEELTPSYTYNNAYYRAGWADTDFALIEIRGNLRNNPFLTWLGWDNSGDGVPYGTCIHYPNGEPLKIAFENNPFVSSDPIWGNSKWKVTFDNSAVYYGSGGAPLLNQNKRIVGQLSQFVTPSVNPGQTIAYCGKFQQSWTGGGTNSTRLSNWLDPIGTSQQTIDSYRPMVILGSSRIISSSTYTIQNLPTNATVSWTLTDIYYNNNCLVQNIYGDQSCTITRSSSQEMTGATLIATATINNSLYCTMEKIVSTGNGFDGTYYNGITTKQIDLPSILYVLPGTSVLITSPNLVGASVSQNGGNATPTSWIHNSSSGTLTVGMPSSPNMVVVVRVACADGTVYNLPVQTTDNTSGQLFVSRSGNSLEISAYSLENTESSELYNNSEMPWKLEVINALNGNKSVSKTVYEKSTVIDTSGWEPGIYIVSTTIGKETFSQKVVIK